MSTGFNGFPKPEQNWSMLPHEFIGMLPSIKTIAEMKVILYILRHTWGYQEYDLPKRITIDEFVNGRKKRDGSRMDKGTGLAEPSVRSGLKAALRHGIIEVEVDNRDKARIQKAYKIKMAGVKVLPPGDKSLTPRVQNSLPRSEKETTETNIRKEFVSSTDEPSPPQMLMKSHIAKWGKEKLTTYFQENEQEVTPLYNLLGIVLAVVPVENLTLTRRRDVTWAHLWMSRALETAGFTVGQYVAWLKQDTAWRKGAAKVTVKELMDKVAVFISNQRETLAPAPRGELVPDYTPAAPIPELTPEERARRMRMIEEGRRILGLDLGLKTA